MINARISFAAGGVRLVLHPTTKKSGRLIDKIGSEQHYSKKPKLTFIRAGKNGYDLNIFLE